MHAHMNGQACNLRMHAHMLFGVCVYVHACMHAHVTLIKCFPHNEKYSLFHSFSFKINRISVSRIRCQT